MWITVNRKCNFKCVWCYAEGSSYGKDMELEKAIIFLELAKKIGIKEPIIIGGEPTLYPHLEEVLAKANILGLRPIVVTNGYLMSDNDYIKSLLKYDFTVSLSLKAYDAKSHEKFTGVSKIEKIGKAIKNLAINKIDFGVSITISSININHLFDMAIFSKKHGAKIISFEMCAPSFDSDGNHNSEYMVHPSILADKLIKTYKNIHDNIGGGVLYHLSQPFCLYPKDFIDKMKRDDALYSGCHVFSRDGIVFDENGDLLLCNCLCGNPVGKFGVDYNNVDTFIDYWEREEAIELNRKLISYPSADCVDCDQYKECGGGCPLMWFSYKPETIIKRRFGNERISKEKIQYQCCS